MAGVQGEPKQLVERAPVCGEVERDPGHAGQCASARVPRPGPARGHHQHLPPMLRHPPKVPHPVMLQLDRALERDVRTHPVHPRGRGWLRRALHPRRHPRDAPGIDPGMQRAHRHPCHPPCPRHAPPPLHGIRAPSRSVPVHAPFMPMVHAPYNCLALPINTRRAASSPRAAR